MEWWKILIIIVITLTLIRLYFYKRQNINIMHSPALQNGKQIAKRKLFDIRDYISDIKDKTPISIIGIAFGLFVLYAMISFDKDKVIVFFFMFLISLVAFEFILKWLLEYNLIINVDITSNPIKIEGYLMSYRIRDRYKIVDETGENAILANHLKSKKGKGYFVNKIDKSNYQLIVSPFHNLSNIHLINDTKNAFIEMRKEATTITHALNNLKAKQDTLVLYEAVEIVERMNMTKQLTEKMKEKDLANVNPTEEQMRELIQELIEENEKLAGE